MQLIDSFCEWFSTSSASWAVWYAGLIAAGCKVHMVGNQSYLLCSLLMSPHAAKPV